MYGSYQRHLAEMARAEMERRRTEALRAEHKAHAEERGIACEKTHLVGASWAPDWECDVCGFKPFGRKA